MIIVASSSLCGALRAHSVPKSEDSNSYRSIATKASQLLATQTDTSESKQLLSVTQSMAGKHLVIAGKHPDLFDSHGFVRRGKYRGWGYLVAKLREDGLQETLIRALYEDHRMPRFTPIYFSPAPVEPKRIYRPFLSNSRIQIGIVCLRKYAQAFQTAEQTHGVDRFVTAAILLVETQCGKNTGRSRILYRLSRLASVLDPENIERNLKRWKKEDSSLTRTDLLQRGRYLEKSFYPEIHALLEIGEQRNINVLEVRGSSAGAFGISQFLPSSYLHFAVDGNGDEVVSLYTPADAIWSTANYLAQSGWHNELPENKQREVIWKYNRSQAYISTVLDIARILRSRLD